MKNILILMLFSTFLSSCSETRTIDVKSPCVSTDSGPCGPRKSVNDWWLKNNV